ncbi:cytochrome c oxidase subunit II transmembrane domain-containing protein [Klebsiella pneumoniae]
MKILHLLTLQLTTFIINHLPTPYPSYFHHSPTPNQEPILQLHHNIMFYLLLILPLLSSILYTILITYSKNPIPYKYIKHPQTIQLISTIFPPLILLIIPFPSFILLYLSHQLISPPITIKPIPYQSYSKYQYSHFINHTPQTLQFQSYLIPHQLLQQPQLTLLHTHTSILLPLHTHITFLLTPPHLIHHFPIPTLPIKLHPTPPTLNQLSPLIQTQPLFYPPSSHFSPTPHPNIPINIQPLSLPKFLK